MPLSPGDMMACRIVVLEGRVVRFLSFVLYAHGLQY